MAEPTYRLRFFFDFGCRSALWSGNDAAHAAFGYPVDLTMLPLSAATAARMAELAEWQETSLNWDYPPDPGPWRQGECDRFNRAARELLATCRAELGARFEIVDEFSEIHEDPDLDAYLRNPKGFQRAATSSKETR
jgi:hypothetical protein